MCCVFAVCGPESEQKRKEPDERVCTQVQTTKIENFLSASKKQISFFFFNFFQCLICIIGFIMKRNVKTVVCPKAIDFFFFF